MTTSLWLRNIAAFGVQTTLVIAVAAVAFRLLRLRNAGVALIFWRAVLISCLLLPLAQPWTVPSTSADPVVGRASVAVDGTSPDAEAMLPPAPTWNATAIALTCIALGIVLRILWLLVGALSLRRLRRTATPLEPVPRGMNEAVSRVGVRATLCVSTRVGGPITFGLTNPVIIFPPSILSLAPHVQAAIAYHELLHVDRRDWLEEVFEEIVRSVFWFHPAIRWVIGRIQLSREQVVDESVIRLLESRDRYV